MTAVLSERLHGGDLVLLRSQYVAVGALICRDAMDSDVSAALADLSPTLLLVPAMSAKTGYMEMQLAYVLSRSQMVAVLGNGPISWGDARDKNVAGRAEAVFIRPATVGAVVSVPSERGPIPPDGQLGFWCCRMWKDPEPVWVPYEPAEQDGTP